MLLVDTRSCERRIERPSRCKPGSYALYLAIDRVGGRLLRRLAIDLSEHERTWERLLKIRGPGACAVPCPAR